MIIASNEDEFVDIEGEENMMYDTTYSQQQSTDGYYSEQAENGNQYVDFSQQQEGGEQYVEYQEGVYGGEYETQESFDGKKKRLFGSLTNLTFRPKKRVLS